MLSPSTEKSLMTITPGLVLAGLYWASDYIPPIPAELTQFLDVAAMVLFLVVAAVGWFFHRTKVIYITLVMAAAYAVLNYYIAGDGAKNIYQFIILMTVATVTPLNFIVISFFEERRKLLSWEFVVITGLIAGEIITGHWLLKNHTQELIEAVLFPKQLGVSLEPWTKLSATVLIVSFISLLIMAFHLVRRFDLINVGMFWACAGCVLAFNTLGVVPEFSIFVIISLLFLGVALMQTWHDIAYLDQLTTLPGRLALNELLKNLSGNYVVAMVDVDFFKKFNDTYGHDVGDQILKLVATKLRNVTGGGHSFRYGGEEFTVVFPGKQVREAFGHLSSLREAIEEAHMILRHKPSRPNARPEVMPQKRQPLRYLNVTVSIGIAENSEDLTTPTAVLKAADEALYRAKERGRNRLSL